MLASFSAHAVRQINRIYDYIAGDNPVAAQAVMDRIYEVAEHVANFPNSGRATVIGSVRMFVVSPYPYVLFFRTVPGRDEVRIFRVQHAARRRPALQESSREFRATV